MNERIINLDIYLSQITNPKVQKTTNWQDLEHNKKVNTKLKKIQEATSQLVKLHYWR